MRMQLVVSVTCVLTLFSGPGTAGEWSGPLFGLAATPNGEVLVADQGRGVVAVGSGNSLFPVLSGITSIAPIGNGSLWITRSGGEGLDDQGQALLRVSRGRARVLVNLFDFEESNNPQTDDVRSNPFDVYSLSGDAALVVDAAGNDLLHIDSEGQVDVVAVFPTRIASLASLKAALDCPNTQIRPVCFMGDAIPAQAVPTSITVGPDGYYYVGELRGFPGPLDQSRIWRIAPWASWADCATSSDCEVVFDGGFTSIIDLSFGPEGLLYVAELDEMGWFSAEVLGIGAGGTINACDLDSLACVEVAIGIPFLTAITFDKNGQLWATRDALDPPLASVIAVP